MTFPQSLCFISGAVAQLGERCVRNAEVRGSTPLGSTLVATIAQLVEHVIRNDGVVGSNPTGGSRGAARRLERARFLQKG